MKTAKREEQLYQSFVKSIRSVGLDELKKTSLFLRNHEEVVLLEKKAA